MRRLGSAFIAAVFVASVTSAGADVVLPAVISDGMVLQRGAATAIWGWADPGDEVVVAPSWLERDLRTTADADGAWRVDVPALEPGGPHEFTVTSGGVRRAVRDVLIGEVWICSGQSNMEWSVARAANPEAEIAAADHPRIRLLTVPNVTAAQPSLDCNTAWAHCTPASAAPFSAVGYFFGRHLAEALDQPIGLISADWGGTVIEAWMSGTALRAFPEFDEARDWLAAAGDPERRGAEIRERLAAWWRDYDGASGAMSNWYEAAFDDSSWESMTLPAALATADMGGFDGVVYYRRSFEIPDAWRGRDATIELGPIDDFDDVWVNGVHVGATHEPGLWSEPRRYNVPAEALSGAHAVVAIRMLDTAGPGGVNGRPDQMVLRASGSTLTPLRLDGPWRYHQGRTTRELPARPTEAAPIGPNVPTALFNGMVAPIVPLGMRGVIWYQGESNRSRPVQYRSLFPAMIEDWRAQWDHDFAFYFVQIAPYRYRGDTGMAALLREAQLRTLAVPGTGMVVTTDIGNPDDIHPRNKQEVGRRLALWALARTYGVDDLEYSGPLFRSMRVDGSAAHLQFDHDEGLRLADSAQAHFVVAGADRVFHDAVARVNGSTVIVTCDAVRHPVAVRYGWEAASEPNLFNGAGLPASPFRTDDWE